MPPIIKTQAHDIINEVRKTCAVLDSQILASAQPIGNVSAENANCAVNGSINIRASDKVNATPDKPQRKKSPNV